MSKPSNWPDPVRRLAAALAILLVAAIGFGVGYLVFDGSEDPSTSPGSIVVVDPGLAEDSEDEADEEDPPAQIGFPALATRNTTRVGGADPTTDAAGVALASYPSTGGVPGPPAALLAPSDSWQQALAATPLAAEPIGAPLLLATADEVPSVTSDALSALSPVGLGGKEDTQVIAIGDVATPDGLETLAIDETDPAKLAAALDDERARLTDNDHPAHLLVVSSKEPELAMPAAAWAARSGDPILFASGDEVPEETLEVIERHPRARVYVLGPEDAISPKAVEQLRKKAPSVERVGTEDPVENAIEFARYTDGTFGWNINDPGHGFTIVNADRPLDAAAAAPLAAGGKPGPLLLTDDATAVPEALQSYLSDTQPGFVDDPSRALYNHIWLLGDPIALSVAFQSQVDALTRLARVSAGTTPLGFGPGSAESEPPADGGRGDDKDTDAADADADADDAGDGGDGDGG